MLKDPNINNSQRASVNRELSKINGRMAQILERFERTPHFSKQAEQYQSRQINDSYNLNPDDPRTCLQMGYVTSNLQCYQRGLNNVNPHQSPGLYAQLQRNLNQRIVKDRRAMTALQQPRQHHHRMSNRGRRGYQRKGMNRPRRTTFQKRKTYYGPTHHHNRRNRGGFSR